MATLLISNALIEPSIFLWYNEETTECSVEYLISLECCDIQLSNSIGYIFIDLLYLKILLKAATLLIPGVLNGLSNFLWSNEWNTRFHLDYIISLESSNVQCSNCICYIFVALLNHKISLKAANLLIYGALMDHLAFCNIMIGLPSSLWSTLYYRKPDGPFNVPEMSGAATFSDILGYSNATNIKYILLESCILQLSSDITYSTEN